MTVAGSYRSQHPVHRPPTRPSAHRSTDPTAVRTRHKEVTPVSISTLDRRPPGPSGIGPSGVGKPGVAAFDDQLPCRTHDPELFFAESPRDVEAAKALCLSCPLRAECLDGALARREPWGVWGGQLFIGGVVVARKRPRGRPRKDAAAVA